MLLGIQNARPAYSWLFAASSIHDISYDYAYFDECSMYCGQADDYYNSVNKIHTDFFINLTRFNFAWNSFECIYKQIGDDVWKKEHTKCIHAKGKRAKINKTDKLCSFLSSNKSDIIPEHRDTFITINELARKAYWCKENPEDFQFPTYVDERGYGIYFIYTIRNNFAHGVNTIIDSSDISKEEMGTPLLDYATKIILFSIQETLRSYIKLNPYFIDDMHVDEQYIYEHKLTYQTIISNAHLHMQYDSELYI